MFFWRLAFSQLLGPGPRRILPKSKMQNQTFHCCLKFLAPEGMTIHGQIEERKIHRDVGDVLDLSEDVLNYSQDEEARFYHQSEVNL